MSDAEKGQATTAPEDGYVFYNCGHWHLPGDDDCQNPEGTEEEAFSEDLDDEHDENRGW